MKEVLGTIVLVLGFIYFATANSKEYDKSKFMYDAYKDAMSDKELSTDELFDAYVCKFFFKGPWEHAIKPKVLENDLIDFNDKPMSLSQLALDIVQEMGYI
jgi:hypothetical protein